MFYEFSSLLTPKNPFIFCNFNLKRINLNKSTVEFVEYLSDVVLHFSTEFIAHNYCLLDKGLADLCIEELHRLFKPVAKFVDQKLVNQVPKVARWLIISLIPIQKTSTTNYLEVFVLM